MEVGLGLMVFEEMTVAPNLAWVIHNGSWFIPNLHELGATFFKTKCLLVPSLLISPLGRIGAGELIPENESIEKRQKINQVNGNLACAVIFLIFMCNCQFVMSIDRPTCWCLKILYILILQQGSGYLLQCSQLHTVENDRKIAYSLSFIPMEGRIEYMMYQCNFQL